MVTPELLFKLLNTPIITNIPNFGYYFGVVDNNVIFTYKLAPIYINNISKLPQVIETMPYNFGIPTFNELQKIKKYTTISHLILELLHLDIDITYNSNRAFYLIPTARYSIS